MNTRILKASILLSWLAMTVWFARYEAFPGFFTQCQRGYKDLFSEGVLIRDTWVRLLFNGKPVGYSHTQVDIDEFMVSERYRTQNRTVLNLVLMGVEERITMTADASLDAMYRLNKFEMNVSARNSDTHVAGRRLRGDVFRITIRSGGGTTRQHVTIPDDTILYSPVTDLAVARLKPGEQLSFKTLDPLSMRATPVTFRAIGPETIELRGTNVQARAFTVEFLGKTTRSWMSTDGDILRYETPMGMIAEACDAREAMEAGHASGITDDILKSLAAKSSRQISDPKTLKRLNVRLSGAPFDNVQVESNRQKIEDRGDDYIELTLSPQLFPERGMAIGSGTDGLEEYLKSSAFIQADHPDIRRTAASIVSGNDDSLEAAQAIYEWVNQKIAKRPAPGIPSALQVLKTREGDCNEHTYLFVALARAARLPAKVKVGITYSRGAFYYHAWPAVFVGQWIEMDPTFGEPGVDAAHIALFEGEFADQLGLLQMIGSLNVEILDEE